MTLYRVTKTNGAIFDIEGTRIEVDGMGTRIYDSEGSVVFTTPGQAEVVPVSALREADAAEPEEEATGKVTKKKTTK
jgi:hypothetical protein